MPLHKAYKIFRDFKINVRQELAKIKPEYHEVLKKIHPDHGGSNESTYQLTSAWNKIRSNPNHDNPFKKLK